MVDQALGFYHIVINDDLRMMPALDHSELRGCLLSKAEALGTQRQSSKVHIQGIWRCSGGRKNPVKILP